ncbi:SAM-dependent methyltransferase [Frankia sp. Cr1]|uniref:SAM-dependent methyltransferase n=1 Tax=Frankia sp. Cr1 TaxID=3073931 RepID=UPI002AD4D7F8|nr:SAM-dependent methyltransferase [Frankia sp. Cr1]
MSNVGWIVAEMKLIYGETTSAWSEIGVRRRFPWPSGAGEPAALSADRRTFGRPAAGLAGLPIATSALVAGPMDRSRPVAVLRFFPEDTGPEELVAVLRDALPAGSYLVISHATGDGQTQDVANAAELYRRTTGPFCLPTRAELPRSFDGCDLVDPGPVYAGMGRLR